MYFQSYSLPSPIIHYITSDNASSAAKLKLLQSCKQFKNQILKKHKSLILDGLYLSDDVWDAKIRNKKGNVGYITCSLEIFMIPKNLKVKCLILDKFDEDGFHDLLTKIDISSVKLVKLYKGSLKSEDLDKLLTSNIEIFEMKDCNVNALFPLILEDLVPHIFKKLTNARKLKFQFPTLHQLQALEHYYHLYHGNIPLHHLINIQRHVKLQEITFYSLIGNLSPKAFIFFVNNQMAPSGKVRLYFICVGHMENFTEALDKYPTLNFSYKTHVSRNFLYVDCIKI